MAKLTKKKVKKKADPTTVWRIYSGATKPPSFVGTVITPKGETPRLHGQNRDPMDLGVMFEAHRSPPVLRGPGKTEVDRVVEMRNTFRSGFPQVAGWFDNVATGLSLRDLFALAALMGDNMNRSPADLAMRCYLVADAMLKQRALLNPIMTVDPSLLPKDKLEPGKVLGRVMTDTDPSEPF